MKLEKLIIAFLAAYIIYCFISKENYAFDEPGVIFPTNDPNVGYIDIYYTKDSKLHSAKISNNISTTQTVNAIQGKSNINPSVTSSHIVIPNFTSKIPKSIFGYGVMYVPNTTKVGFYRPITEINNNKNQFLLYPGKELVLSGIGLTNLGTNADFNGFKAGDLIHTARFVFNF